MPFPSWHLLIASWKPPTLSSSTIRLFHPPLSGCNCLRPIPLPWADQEEICWVLNIERKEGGYSRQWEDPKQMPSSLGDRSLNGGLFRTVPQSGSVDNDAVSLYPESSAPQDPTWCSSDNLSLAMLRLVGVLENGLLNPAHWLVPAGQDA